MLVDLFKTLAHQDRLRIINLISIRPVCLCELEILLELSQSSCSKHLHQLIAQDIIIVNKVSLWNEYHLNEDFVDKNPWLIPKIKQEDFSNDNNRLTFYDTHNYDSIFDNTSSQAIKEQFNLHYTRK